MTDVPPGSSELTQTITWSYTDTGQYRRKIVEGMPPLIITCAVTGKHQKRENPNLPVTAEEQAETAAAVYDAGAQIVHIHGREADDPTQESNDPLRLRQINALMRNKASQIIIDNTQTVDELRIDAGELAGRAYRFKSAPQEAKPEIMSLSPGPMTFRGGDNSPSKVLVTTFDDTERLANDLREHGIKPQVFLYHAGHLDLLEHLITRNALDKPYFVQLVFGQQSGIPTSPDSVLFMVRNLPEDCIFQTCALGLEQIHVNILSILLGGHVRTGMEDNLLYQGDEPVRDNVQLVVRIVRIAKDLGRRTASGQEARQILGLGPPTDY